MTEYDYSPDAYRRQIETQARIAKWVDSTTDSPPQEQSPTDLAPPHDYLTPAHSISQYQPSPQPGHPPGYIPVLPGPTPYGAVYAPPPQHHRHHRDSRSSSSSSRRSRSHPHHHSRHQSTAYIISPGPTPYAYPASPPITPAIPPVVVQVPRREILHLVSPPPPYQNGYLQPYPPQQPSYPAPVPQHPYPYSAGMHPPPPPPFQPTFLPITAAPQFMQRRTTPATGYPSEWRRSF